MKTIFGRNKNIYFIAGLSVLCGFVGLVFSVLNTRAATIAPGPLLISYTDDQLFSETNIGPGDVIVKDVSVRNTGTLPHSFSISATDVSGNLASVLQIEPRENGKAIWNETLSNLSSSSNGSKVVVSSIEPGTTRNLQIAAIFPANSGNDFQRQSVTSFNFVLGNESTDQREPNNFLTSANRALVQQIISAVTYNPSVADSVKPTDNQTAEEGSAKGATTTAKELCFWWLMLMAILIIFLFLYRKYIKTTGKFMLWWLWPIAISATLYFTHNYLSRDLNDIIFCSWFWAFELAVLIAYYIYELKEG